MISAVINNSTILRVTEMNLKRVNILEKQHIFTAIIINFKIAFQNLIFLKVKPLSTFTSHKTDYVN